MAPEFDLAWTEIRQAASMGVNRRLRGIKKGRTDTNGKPDDTWGTDIHGAIGEFAVAKHFNIFWSDIAGLDKDKGDFASFDVRTTAHWNGRLWLYPSDQDDRIFILVTLDLPTVRIAGWKLACDGKVPKYKETSKRGGTLYYVPQPDLDDMGAM